MEKNLTLFPQDLPPSRLVRFGPFILVVFLGISRLWVAGYAFGTGDHSWQVPLVRGLAAGEHMKDYIFARPVKLSLFFPIMGFLARYVQIEHVYFAGYVLASVAAALAVYFLAAKVTGSRAGAVLAVVLLMVGKDVAAGATTWDSLFLPRVAAMPLLLFSWWLILEERHAAAGLLMGAAFALHPLTGVYGAPIGIFALLASPGWRRALGAFAAGAAVPVIVTAVYILPSEGPFLEASPDWYRAMVVRNLHHITDGNFFVLAALLVYALAVGAWVTRAGGNGRLLTSATATAAVVFMYVAAVQIGGRFAGLADGQAALFNPPVVAILQPLRISGPLGVLIFIATASVLWRTMQGGLVGRLSGLAALAALCFAHYVVGAGFLAAAILSIAGLRPLRVAAAVLFAAALTASLFFHKTLFILTLSLMAGSTLVTLAARTKLRSAASALVAVVVFVGIVPPHWAATAARRAFGSAAADTERYMRPVRMRLVAEPALLEAAKWLKRNTAPEEVAIVPPWWENFRVASERPVFGTYKDGTLVFFDEALAGEWLGRMEALSVPLWEAGGSRLTADNCVFYKVLGGRRMRAAAEEYRADYAVLFSEGADGLEPVFKGKHVIIYRIPGWE